MFAKNKSYRRVLLAYASNYAEVLIFLLIWIGLSVCTLAISLATGFYKTPENRLGILTEIHGSLFELLVVGVAAGWILTRKPRNAYREVTSLLRWQLCHASSECLSYIPVRTRGYDQTIFTFGKYEVVLPDWITEGIDSDDKFRGDLVVQSIISSMTSDIKDWSSFDGFTVPTADGRKRRAERAQYIEMSRKGIQAYASRIEMIIVDLGNLPESSSLPDLIELATGLKIAANEYIQAAESACAKIVDDQLDIDYTGYSRAGEEVAEAALRTIRHIIPASDSQRNLGEPGPIKDPRPPDEIWLDNYLTKRKQP